MQKPTQNLDTFLLTIATISLLSSGYLLFDDSLISAEQQASSSSAIGSIVTSINDVRRKFDDNFVWLPANLKDTIYEGDSVFTGDQSEATVKFTDGTEIGISSNSMVVIKKTDQNTSLDLQFGDVVGKLSSAKSQLVIKSGKKKTVLKGKQAEVSISKARSGQTKLRVVKGKVDVESAGKKKSLKKNQSLDVKESGEIGAVKQAVVELLAPKFQDTLYLQDDAPIEFKWKSSRPVEKFLLEVAEDRNFSNSIYRKVVSGQDASVTSLPSDRVLFWRVGAVGNKDQGKANSFSSQFKTFRMQAPLAQTPANLTEVFFEVDLEDNITKDQTIHISWKASQFAKGNQLIIAKDKRFSDRVLNKGTLDNFFEFSPEEETTYYWRVRRVYNKKHQSEWSELRSFTVRFRRPERPLAPPPTLAEPVEFTLPYEEVAGDPASPTLTWTPVEKADGYLIEVSSDPEFRSLVASERTTDPSWSWPESTEGEYFWRVSAISPSDVQGEYSEVRRIQINAPIIPLVAPALVTPLIERRIEEPLQIDLKWSTVPEAKEYSLQMSDRTDFSSPKEFKVEQPELKAEFKEQGVTFWRVQAVRENGELGPWSSMGTVSLQNATLGEVTLNTPESLEIDPYQARKNRLKISWSKVAEAQSYQVLVSQVEDFSKTIEKSSTKSNAFTLKNMKPGPYFFRVRAQSEDGRNGPYATTSLVARFPDQAMKKFSSSAEELMDKNDSFNVLLTWEKTLHTEEYALQVSESADLKKGKRFRLKETTKKLKFKGGKTIHWAVQPLNKAGKALSSFSKVQKIDLNQSRGILLAPALDLPEDESTQFFQGDRFVKFTWKGVKKASRYQIQVAQDEEFSKKVIDTRPKELKYFWQGNIRNGQYYWRVRSENKKYQSDWSKVREFFVTGE